MRRRVKAGDYFLLGTALQGNVPQQGSGSFFIYSRSLFNEKNGKGIIIKTTLLDKVVL